MQLTDKSCLYCFKVINQPGNIPKICFFIKDINLHNTWKYLKTNITHYNDIDLYIYVGGLGFGLIFLILLCKTIYRT